MKFIIELRNIGPFPLWASSVDLVSVSVSNQLLPRIKSTIEKCDYLVYFLFGEKNKGLFTSEKLVKQYQLPLIFIPEAGHLMFENNPSAFWKVIKQSLLLLNVKR